VVNTHLILTRYLIGGFSKANQQKGWRERFDIFVKHYGLFYAIIYHLYFLFRAVRFRIIK